ncbi:hypothetical protein T10_9750 [Trichinella papuae]|uniref:Uncharacterized protein n=1 Tax=Trichinella papuae TaxID=268474 RepID=A0A0V1M8M4_9BILA|nr:hypothetical protein T10_7643 [Trichinella papuae]KRZ66260.1 hypothetical protein T10_8719 [Trichinella papuae]KRZ67762.1 hypothetical protein T10_8842 [Trichinella papuae]KRZ67781.1 hypothetical protein T10_9750 [Trichinella papuae]
MPTETVCTNELTAAQLRFCTCRSVGQLCFRHDHLASRLVQQTAPSESILNTTQPSIHCTLETSARSAQPLEPILVPKLRIRFADFPYLHYSIGQRLFTLETCCGYQYDQVRDLPGVARIFTYRRERSEHRERVGVLWIPESLSPDNPVPGNASLKKKRKLFSKLTTVIFRVRLRYRAIELNANPKEIKALLFVSVTRFRNINRIPFRKHTTTAHRTKILR